MQYTWKEGKLVKGDKVFSLLEAYFLIPYVKGIARACKGILVPHKPLPKHEIREILARYEE